MKRFLIPAVLILLLTACTLVTPTPIPEATETPEPTPVPTQPPPANSPAGFRNFLAEIEDTILDNRPPLLNLYWAKISQTPLVDDATAVFLFRGEASSVMLAGDMTGFLDDAQIALQRINGTDLWWHEMPFEADTRLDYNFIVAEQNVLDPNNPFTAPSGFGAKSELRMGGYADPEWLQDPKPYAAGTLTEHSIDSQYLNGRRTFLVYKPASQLVGAQTPALIVQDGSEAVNLVNMPRLLDTLIGRRELTPVVVAFVPPFDRFTEYWRNDDYADFLALEVLPLLQTEYETDPAPENNGLLGASLGGLISLHTAMRHSDRIGLVAAQSGAFVADEDSIINDLAESAKLPLKIHLIAGTYETTVAPGTFPDPDFYAGNQRLAAVLEQKGYQFVYEEFPQGHSWGLWRSQLGEGLTWLYR